MKAGVISFFAVSALLFIIHCTNQEDYYTVEVIDGVRTVHNIKPQWGDEPEVALEFVQRIGNMETEDENYQLSNIFDVDRDEEGSIYVLDMGSRRVQKFDSNGSYLATIGHEGDGPGEFRVPLNVNVDQDGQIFVGDADGNKIVVFDQSGKEVRRFRISGMKIQPFLRLLNQELLIMGDSFAYSLPGLRDKYNLFRVFDINGTIQQKFGTPEFFNFGDRLFVDMQTRFAVDKDHNIVVAYRYTNTIRKLDGKGNWLLSAERPIRFELNEFRLENGRVIQPNTVSMGVGIDHKERIWVLTLTKQPESFGRKGMLTPKSHSTFEIFSNEGILLGEVSVPQDIFQMRIKDDRLLIVGGEQISVYEYKIVEK